jgi:hypothetical protein
MIEPYAARPLPPVRGVAAGPVALCPHDRDRPFLFGVLAGSLQLTVTPPEEVSPMNAVSMWVLPLPVTAGRLT